MGDGAIDGFQNNYVIMAPYTKLFNTDVHVPSIRVFIMLLLLLQQKKKKKKKKKKMMMMMMMMMMMTTTTTPRFN